MQNRLRVLIGLIPVVAAVGAVLFVTGTTSASTKKQWVIGYGGNISLPILAEAETAAQAEAKKLGVKLVIANSNDGATQTPAMHALIAQHVDAITVDPWDSYAIDTSVKEANAAHIPVITWVGTDLVKNSGKVVTYIAADDVKGAEAVSEYIFKKMGGKGEIGYIQGDKSHIAGQTREQGFRQALAKFPGIKLVAYGVGGWDTAKSRDVALNFLSAHPNIKAILTNYDGMSQGAYSAAQTAHKNILISGVDGECPMLQSIWQGRMTATFDQIWTNISAQSIDKAVDTLKGMKVPARIETPFFTVDKQVMQQVMAGTYKGGDAQALAFLKAQVKKAINGCK
jgi:ABC-type sugar transport system substrate-binding protein